ncbi:hypothetical protein D3C78_1810060 [compost metagenome]
MQGVSGVRGQQAEGRGNQHGSKVERDLVGFELLSGQGRVLCALGGRSGTG